MNNLMEKSKERLNSSWLSHPVTGCTSAPSSSVDFGRDPKPFWLAEDFLCGDTEPLPSMFRSQLKASETEQRIADTDLAGSASPKSAAAVETMLRWTARLSKSAVSNRTASYIAGFFLLIFAAVDGILLTASPFSAGQKAPIASASAVLDQNGAETAMVFSAPSSDAAVESQAPLPAPAQGALPQGEPWPAAAGTLAQLLAKQNASQPAAVQQAENERLLERLEAWMNARTQKPAAVAEACAGPAPQCWKTVIRIQ